MAKHPDLFDISPISILSEDWLGVRRAVLAKIAQGIDNFDAWLDAHPEFNDEVRQFHTVTDANQMSLNLMGFKNFEELQANVATVLPSDPTGKVVRAIARGDSVVSGERLLRTFDGRRVPIIWRATLPKEEEGFRHLYFYAFDISEQKAQQDALTAARANLNHAGRLSLVGELSASLAHEVSQPLSSIMTFAHVAQTWMTDANHDLEKARSAIDRIGNNARHAAQVVKRIKNFAKHSSAALAAMRPHALVQESLTLVEHEATRRGALLNVKLDDDLPSVTADPTQIQQVIVNMVVNALQAMVAAEVENREVVIHAQRSDTDRILFRIDDTGPGIPAEGIERIFDPFYTTKEEGVGLGLAICRRIIEDHGGKLWAANTEQGASMRFTLPVAA